MRDTVLRGGNRRWFETVPLFLVLCSCLPGSPSNPGDACFEPVATIEGYWRLPFLPVRLSVDSHGEVVVSGDRALVTPVGMFGLRGNLPINPEDPRTTVVVVDRRRPVGTERALYLVRSHGEVLVRASGMTQTEVSPCEVTIDVTEGEDYEVWFNSRVSATAASNDVRAEPDSTPDWQSGSDRYEVRFSRSTLTARKDGRRLWRLNVNRFRNPYTTVQGKVTSDYVIIHAAWSDLTGDGNMELLVVANHRRLYPGLVLVLNESGGVMKEYWHPGRLFDVLAIDLDGSGEKEIVAVGGNNDLDRPIILALSSVGGSGQGPPYLGEGRSAEHVWYTTLPGRGENGRNFARRIFLESSGRGVLASRPGEGGWSFLVGMDGTLSE